MDLSQSYLAVGILLGGLLALTIIETLIPLQARRAWNNRHLPANLILTVTTFATGAAFNVALLLGFLWLQSNGVGLFNMLELEPLIEIGGAILVLDLAWYATHVSMHKMEWMWRFHAVHHSDPALDVTTTARQHPGESVIRYVYLAAFGFAVGASPLAFAIYRVWSALHGQLEHANIKLPQPIDTLITALFSSPNMHKIHHSTDRELHDTNYGNIFSIWDRLFGTFTPAKYGREIDYGLDGYETRWEQSTIGLITLPFRRGPDGDTDAERASDETSTAQQSLR